jgi:hypothetical protein
LQGIVDAFTSIARKESLAGLFRGLGPTVLTNAPFSALYYMFYKQLQSRLSKVIASAAGGHVSIPVPTHGCQEINELRASHACAAVSKHAELHLPRRLQLPSRL